MLSYKILLLDGHNHNHNQEEQGLKTLTPQQILCTLPISSAQLKAENNSQELKNEIRVLLYQRS